MDSPETYNRVNKIARNGLHSLLSTASILLCLASIGLFSYHYLTSQISLELTLIVATPLALIAFICWKLARSLKQYCKFCGGELAHINRDMILSSEYLAMQGKKVGDYYYAPCKWGKKHSPTGWAKISHRATACHHCRISREGYKPFYEITSEQELSDIKGNKP